MKKFSFPVGINARTVDAPNSFTTLVMVVYSKILFTLNYIKILLESNF